ncbi:MAG: hypothetical protein JNM65_04510 [Verrucomicrobiaceae bacterium]|nr:hypothetical protein [Verrucomicrobiaceae bacterium]
MAALVFTQRDVDAHGRVLAHQRGILADEAAQGLHGVEEGFYFESDDWPPGCCFSHHDDNLIAAASASHRPLSHAFRHEASPKPPLDRSEHGIPARACPLILLKSRTFMGCVSIER